MDKKELTKDLEIFEEALLSKKKIIAYTAPAVKVAFSEMFDIEPGIINVKKLVGLLRLLGFSEVYDLTFGADLTIMEEASELVYRLKHNTKLPMFTSCCPAWVKYAEMNYKDLLGNLSTAKSPVGMIGAMFDSYYLDTTKQKREDFMVVGITPCALKKLEIKREDINGTDLILTIDEIKELIDFKNIKYEDIEESEYDSLFKEGSGAGSIFGNTGGVCEAALRTAYFFYTGKKLEKLEFENVRGMEHLKETKVDFNGKILNILVINQMVSAKDILDEISEGNSKYHFIEVMSCLGGCIGGAGLLSADDEIAIREKRIKALYNIDKKTDVRCSHENPDVLKVYKEFLGKRYGEKSHKILHIDLIKED